MRPTAIPAAATTHRRVGPLRTASAFLVLIIFVLRSFPLSFAASHHATRIRPRELWAKRYVLDESNRCKARLDAVVAKPSFATRKVVQSGTLHRPDLHITNEIRKHCYARGDHNQRHGTQYVIFETHVFSSNPLPRNSPYRFAAKRSRGPRSDHIPEPMYFACALAACRLNKARQPVTHFGTIPRSGKHRRPKLRFTAEVPAAA